MTQTVTAEDGTVHNFPDEATPEMMAQALGVSHDPVAAQGQQDQGFVSRVSQDYQKRLNEGQRAADAYVAGNQSLPLTYLDMAGKVGAGTGADVIGEALKSAYSYAPQGVQNAVGNVVHAVSTSPVGDAARYVGNQYHDLAQTYPNAARHVEAAADIGGMLAPEIPIKGTTIAGTALDAAVSGAKAVPAGVRSVQAGARTVIDTTKDLTASALERAPAIDNYLGQTVRPTAVDLKTASQAGYGDVASSTTQISPKLTNSVIDSFDGLTHKDPMAATIAGDNPLAALSDDLQPFRNQPMTLQRATAIDQALTDRMEQPAFTDKNGVLNSYGRQVLQVKQNLRDQLANAVKNGHVQGDPTAINSYFNAVKDWAAQSQMNEIQRIVDRASYMDNPATSLKTGFRNIAVNPGRLKQFSPDVQLAIKSAASSGDLANILRTEIGSRLISGATGAAAGSVGGPIGAIGGTLAGLAASRYARGAAENMQMGRVNKVMDAIAQNSSLQSRTVPRSQIMRGKSLQGFYDQPRAPAAPPLALPAPPAGGSSMFVDREGNISRTPNPANQIVNANPLSINPQPYADPYPQRPPQLALPAPGRATMSNDEAAQMAAKLRQPPPPSPTIITPASQVGKLQNSLPPNSIRSNQLNNLADQLRNGGISQNKFVETSMRAFGLNTTQARSLAKEVLNYNVPKK